jgi:RNA polymerase sigma-70 factor (ECF subfamily)
MEWITTSTILAGLRDFGNAAAWERLSARFRGPIVGFARSLGLPPADAEDVAQETLLAFAEEFRRGRYDREQGRLSAWLFGIALNQVRRHRRADEQRVRPLAGNEGATSFWDELADPSTARSTWEQEWEQALFAECLEQVRREVEPATLAAFELVVCEQLPTDQAAARLNVPVKTVYNAKHRVLRRIRELRAQLESTA